MVSNKSKVLIAMGGLAIAEAVLAMCWKANDRTPKAQAARLCRIAGGVTLMMLAVTPTPPTQRFLPLVDNAVMLMIAPEP